MYKSSAAALAVLFIPFLGSAQNPDHRQDSSLDNETSRGVATRALPPTSPREAPRTVPGDTVSVHELSIPGKARKAFDKGVRLRMKNDAAGSIAEFQRAVEAYPSYYEAYYQIGNAQLDLEHGGEAAAAFSSAIRVSDGQFAKGYFALALVLCKEGNFSEADTLAKTGLSLEPSATLGELALGWAELGLGRLSIAEKALREALAQKADVREARLLLLETHRRESKLPELVEDVDAYLKLDASSAMSGQLRKLRDEAQARMGKTDDKGAIVARTQP